MKDAPVMVSVYDKYQKLLDLMSFLQYMDYSKGDPSVIYDQGHKATLKVLIEKSKVSWEKSNFKSKFTELIKNKVTPEYIDKIEVEFFE